jgi:hypothetical protein
MPSLSPFGSSSATPYHSPDSPVSFPTYLTVPLRRRESTTLLPKGTFITSDEPCPTVKDGRGRGMLDAISNTTQFHLLEFQDSDALSSCAQARLDA